MRYKKPTSLGRLRKIYKTVTGISSWSAIFRSSKKNGFNSDTYKVLTDGNTRLMLRDIREWLVIAEKELL